MTTPSPLVQVGNLMVVAIKLFKLRSSVSMTDGIPLQENLQCLPFCTSSDIGIDTETFNKETGVVGDW